MYTKIQVIKMLRDNVPGMGLKEAKDVVDSYDLKNFEDRVARSFGEEARGELRSWARQFVAKENKPFSYIEANVPDTINNEPYGEDYCCPDCNDSRY
jgi:hypothetical protein